MKQRILQGNIVQVNETKYGQLIIDNDKISRLIFDEKEYLSNPTLIDNDKFICPGFIELQINGAFGKEFKTDSDSIQIASDNLLKFGTTSFCPTVTTRDIKTYPKHLDSLIENFKYAGGTKFLGFHLEGPSLNPKKVGAQNADLITNPIDIDLNSYLNENVKMVTLAPELEGGIDFIKKLINKNIRVGIGHSLMSYEEVNKIFDSNYMWIVHLFNAMEPLKSREPGVVGFGLNSDAFIGLIVDKIHLHPKTVEITSKLKLDKIISVSDGSAVTGLDAGTYKIGERTMIKTNERVTLPNGTLVGSILTQNIAVKNLIEINNCSINDAVKTVSYNPAKLLGLENTIGQIKVGNFADLTVLDNSWNIDLTFINGELAYEKK